MSVGRAIRTYLNGSGVVRGLAFLFLMGLPGWLFGVASEDRFPPAARLGALLAALLALPGVVAASGFQLELIRRVSEGDDSLPQWSPMSDLVHAGWRPWCNFFVLFLPISGPFVGVQFAAAALSHFGGFEALSGLILGLGLLFYLGGLTLVGTLAPAVWMNLVLHPASEPGDSGSFSHFWAGLRPGQLFGLISQAPGRYLKLLLLMWVVGLFVLSGILFVGIGLLITAPVGALAMIHLIGQALALHRGHPTVA